MKKLADGLEVILKKLDKVFEIITALLLAGMVILIFAQVVCRYVFSAPLAWSEELARYLFIWMTFIAAYVAARKGKHIGVEALQKALPKPAGKFVKALCNIFCGVFFSAVFVYILKFWEKLQTQKSPATNIPISVVYLGILIGCFFMAILYYLNAIRVYTDKPEEAKS